MITSRGPESGTRRREEVDVSDGLTRVGQSIEIYSVCLTTEGANIENRSVEVR